MKSLAQVTLQVRELLGFELREYLLAAPCTRETGPGKARPMRPSASPGLAAPLHQPLCPILGFCLFPTSPTKCPQAAKEPKRSQQLVKNIIFLSFNLEADSELLGCGDWRTIFSEETIFPWIKGTCL